LFDTRGDRVAGLARAEADGFRIPAGMPRGAYVARLSAGPRRQFSTVFIP
jgi:hypothetical protein